MTKEEIIRNLKYTMKKHKNDTVNTFDTNISVMCKDILDYFEEQEPCENAVLEQISDEVNKLKKVSNGNKVYVGINDVFDIIDKYKAESEE